MQGLLPILSGTKSFVLPFRVKASGQVKLSAMRFPDSSNSTSFPSAVTRQRDGGNTQEIKPLVFKSSETEGSLIGFLTPEGNSQLLAFQNKDNVDLDTQIISNEITLNEFQRFPQISVRNGQYSINGGEWTDRDQNISPGDKLRVQVKSANDFLTASTVTILIGEVSGSFVATTRAADQTPDNLRFDSVNNVDPGAIVESNLATVSGLEIATPIRVVGATYSKNNAPYTDQVDTLKNGDVIKLKVTASSMFENVQSAVLYVGSFEASFSVTTRAARVLVNNFTIPPIVNAERSTELTSASVSLSGFETPVPISVLGGSYSINNGPFSNTAGNVPPNSTLRVRLSSSPLFSTKVAANVTVGSLTKPFDITTRAGTTTPASFSFTPITGVERNALVVSESVSVTGFEVASPISIVGGEYSINGGSYSSAPGSLPIGASLRLRLTSSPNFNTKLSATVNIGGISRGFDVSTRLGAATPSAFSINPVTGVERSALTVSEAVSLSGYEVPISISVQGGEYSINGGTFSSANGMLPVGASLRVRLSSSASFDTKLSATVNIGGLIRSFDVTTRSGVTTPANFAFDPVMNAQLNTLVTSGGVTLSGFEVPVSISISGGEYSINNGAFTSATGTISSGSNLKLRLRSSTNFLTKTSTSVTISGVTKAFEVTTRAGIVDPQNFSFTAVFGVERNTPTTSTAITLTGYEVPSPISIIGGEYSLNGGAFSSASGSLPLGASLRVRVTSSTAFLTNAIATVTVGNISSDFVVRTRAGTTAPNAFSFSPIDGAERNTLVTSSPVTLSAMKWQPPLVSQVENTVLMAELSRPLQAASL